MSRRIFASLVLVAFAALPLGAQAASSARVPTPAPQPSLPPLPNVAPGYAAPSVSPGPAHLVGVIDQPFVGITLENAVGMALLKNPDLAVSSANTRIAAYRIAAARGSFDVRFNVEPSVTNSTSAPSNPFFAGPNYGPLVQNQQQIAGGVSGQLPIGTQYSAKVTDGRTDSNSVFNGFNPYYTPSFSLDLSQPLLKNAGENPAQNALKLAIIGNDATQAQTLVSVSQTIAQVQDAYWDLVSAWRNVAIQEDALREAVLQQGSTSRLAKAGAAANIDAVESSGQVAMFQDNVYSALQSVAQLQNQLKALIVDDSSDQIWQANLVPTSPVLRLPTAPTLDGLLAEALKQRPEVRQIADAQRVAAENLKFARNQARPQFDLKLGFASNSWAGTPENAELFSSFSGAPIVTPPYLVGGNGQAFNNLWSNKFPSYTARVVFTTPIGNHTGKANVAIAQEQQRIAGLQSSGVFQRVVVESRNALQGYQSALARLQAASVARKTADQVYQSEVRKFKNGVSTTYLVLQRQVELAQARGRELQAQTDLNKAVVELERVSGNNLLSNNVDLTTMGSQANPSSTEP